MRFPLLLVCALTVPVVGAQTTKRPIPYADVKSIIDVLRDDLIPAELRGRPAGQVEVLWPEWVSRHDASVRARVEAGDEDSIVHLLLFGTTFTKAPRASDRDLTALVAAPAAGVRALRARIDDFAAAVTAPGSNERLQFARQLIERKGIDPTTEAGQAALRQYLDERTQVVGGSVRSSTILDPSADAADKLTVFRDRGLSADTSIFIDLGIERALDAATAAGALRPGSVRRVAVIGPGLDFVDKLQGYDFYPPQTLQPFAVIDTLLRLDLASADALRVTAFDLSPRVLRHLEESRTRAQAGMPYTAVLPRATDRPWTPELVEYWTQFGNWIGAPAARVPPAPAGAGRVEVRAVDIRPSVVLSIVPADLNVVAERVELADDERFDLIVATNILIYYDVFEQAMASANIARMLQPNGLFLTNSRLIELPGSPLSAGGHADVTYMTLPGIGDAGDRVTWYTRP